MRERPTVVRRSPGSGERRAPGLALLLVLAAGAVPLAVAAGSGPLPGGFPPRLWPAPPPEPFEGYLILQAEGPGAAKVLIDGRFAGTVRQGVLAVPVCAGDLVELDGRLSGRQLRVTAVTSAPLRLLPAAGSPLEPSGRLLLAGWVRGPAWPP